MLAYAIIAHLVGDFLIQTDRMAEGKKRSTSILLLHGLTYIIPFIPLMFIFPEFTYWKIMLIVIQHISQDGTNFVIWFMYKTGKIEFSRQPPLSPWSVIVVDNTLHLLFIAVILLF